MRLLIDGIHKSFGDKEVLKGCSYIYEQGRVYALLGRNGAGKTTLFKLIAKLLDSDRGSIYLEENGQKQTPNYDDLFLMVSEPTLPQFLTGREFIRFFIDVNRENIRDLKPVDEYFDIIDFDSDDRDRLIQGYSTGMKNKLQMMMFLILRPKVILMDEPLTSLDVVVQVEIKRLIRQIHDEHIILFSTHIPQLALDLCDEVTLLIDGQLEYMPSDKKDPVRFEEEILRSFQNKQL